MPTLRSAINCKLPAPVPVRKMLALVVERLAPAPIAEIAALPAKLIAVPVVLMLPVLLIVTAPAPVWVMPFRVRLAAVLARSIEPPETASNALTVLAAALSAMPLEACALSAAPLIVPDALCEIVPPELVRLTKPALTAPIAVRLPVLETIRLPDAVLLTRVMPALAPRSATLPAPLLDAVTTGVATSRSIPPCADRSTLAADRLTAAPLASVIAPDGTFRVIELAACNAPIVKLPALCVMAMLLNVVGKVPPVFEKLFATLKLPVPVNAPPVWLNVLIVALSAPSAKVPLPAMLTMPGVNDVPAVKVPPDKISAPVPDNPPVIECAPLPEISSVPPVSVTDPPETKLLPTPATASVAVPAMSSVSSPTVILPTV